MFHTYVNACMHVCVRAGMRLCMHAYVCVRALVCVSVV